MTFLVGGPFDLALISPERIPWLIFLWTVLFVLVFIKLLLFG
jgi:hypothetical protein